MKIDVHFKAFDDLPILGDVCLEVGAGEFHVLCGPSGIGKTTLLRLISGLDDDYVGAITPKPQRIGYVFQEPRLLPWLSVYDNLKLVCEERADRIDSLLEEVGLQEDRHTPASKLSLGMARRVALARALIVQPEILILDEPFVSLDPARAASLRKLTFDLVRKHGLKALLVTHDPSEAVELGDYIHILSGQPARITKTVRVDFTDENRFCSTSVQAYLNAHQEVFAFS